LLLTVASLALLGVASHAQGQATPKPGIYAESGGKTTPIAGTLCMNAKPKGLAKTMLSMGFSKGATEYTLTGAASDTHVPASASFMIYLDPEAGKPMAPPKPGEMPDFAKMQAQASGEGMPAAKSGKEFLLIPLVVADDTRLADIPNGGGNKAAVPMELTEITKKLVYKLQPKAPLAPGEYTFYWQAAGSGGGGGQFWTFGVTK
jgi:hypothetical protein